MRAVLHGKPAIMEVPRAVYQHPRGVTTTLEVAAMARIQRLCSVEGCERAFSAKGLCRAHYQRVQRHGHVTSKRNGLLRVEGGLSSPEFFWTRVNKEGPIHPELGTPCWLWEGRLNKGGYGSFAAKLNSMKTAHLFSYFLANGAPPKGLHVDHLCRVRHCVNPSHLEAVTPGVNAIRGFGFPGINARKTHCPKGHPYDMVVLQKRGGQYRTCRRCGVERSRRYRLRKKERAAL